jgi:Right handed beta helix region
MIGECDRSCETGFLLLADHASEYGWRAVKLAWREPVAVTVKAMAILDWTGTSPQASIKLSSPCEVTPVLKILFGILLAAVAAGFGFASAAADQVYSGCPQNPETAQAVHVANRESLPHLLALARGGDVIQLSGGDYGAVKLTADNAAFVTLTSGPGQKPRLTSLEISGSHWRVSGLTIVGFTAPGISWDGWQRHDALVKIVKAKDVQVSGNFIASTESEPAWDQESRRVVQSDALSSGIGVMDSACVSIANNQIKNVFNGVTIGGEISEEFGHRFLIFDNKIDDFAGDGIDHSVSDILISRNVITNAHNICDSLCIHQDGIQGWNSIYGPKVVSEDVVIDGNTIIRVARANLPKPSNALQGITIFDGNWSNIQVTNNIVVVNAWHGITLTGPRSAFVVNNTVVGDTPRPTWIMIAAQKTGSREGAPKDVVVANNIATGFRLASTGLIGVVGVVTRNNYTTVDPEGAFKVFDVKSARFDLHIRHPHGEMEDGQMTRPAVRDIDGNFRSERTELGAYASSSGPP